MEPDESRPSGGHGIGCPPVRSFTLSRPRTSITNVPYQGESMNTRKSLIAFVAVLALLAALAPASADKMPLFPKAGQYTIHSQPSFLISVGDSKETITCEATLVVQAGDPYVTAKGTRRVDLTVVDWKANGKSDLLGGPINFRMLKGVKVNDDSFVETYGLAKAGKDFPAQAQFTVPYELDTPFGTVSNLVGVTRGNIKAFPPRGDTFRMEKGDIAKLLAEMMPAPLSAMSASGEVTPMDVTIRPLACDCPDAGIATSTATATGSTLPAGADN
jgi:hypothetical protein